MTHDLLRFAHVLSVVFMSVPLYNLIVVNERVRFGKAPFPVDRYFENIIKGAAIRCYVYQLTALATGLLLAGSLASLANPVLLAKLVLLGLLTALLSLVHFRVQPAIEALLGRVEGEVIAPEIAAALGPLRLLRKRLAAVCLFTVILTVLLGLQVYAGFGLLLNAALVVLAALFAWRAYRTPVTRGWW